MIHFNKCLTIFEINLNVIGYFHPKKIEKIRTYYGLTQIISSIAIESIATVGAIILNLSHDQQNSWRATANSVLPYFSHGLGNLGRALFENSGDCEPFLFIYDAFIYRFSY